MAIEGTYKVELTTTLGTENIILTLDTFRDSLNGYMEGFFGQQSFQIAFGSPLKVNLIYSGRTPPRSPPGS